MTKLEQEPPQPERDTLGSWTPRLGAWVLEGVAHFRVWAPTAESVDAVLETPGRQNVCLPLTRNVDGYFTGSSASFGAGDLYRYRVDSRGPFPDPASRFQPKGVHGPSGIVDGLSFPWSDPRWQPHSLERLVFYELHIGTFSEAGTFAGAVSHLGRIRDLGVTAIEIMPVADFPGRWNWGYDGVALFAPARCYGEPDDLRRLVDAAHQLGLSAFLDVVYNHFGPDGNYLGAYSPYYFTERRHSPWGAGVNLDGEQHSAVRSFFIENARYWIHEFHMDGLRLDATHAMMDDSDRHFLAELGDCVRRGSNGRAVYLVAEDNRNLARMIQPEAKGGWGMDAVWADDYHHEIRRFFTGDHEGYFEPYTGAPDDIAAVVERGWITKDPGDADYSRYVVCLQNHDQVGNRAFGERLHHQIPIESYRAASALLLLGPETPLLFMGQEWGATSPFLYFTDHQPELGRLVTEGRRNEFRHFSAFADPANRSRIPDPQSAATFEKSKLHWSESGTGTQAGLWRLYQRLIKLRLSEPALISPRRGDAHCWARRTTVFLRRRNRGQEILLIACLRGGGRWDLGDIDPAAPTSAWQFLLHTELPEFAGLDSGGIGIALPRVEFRRPGAVLLQRAL